MTDYAAPTTQRPEDLGTHTTSRPGGHITFRPGVHINPKAGVHMALRPGAHVTFKAVAHIIFKAGAHITPEVRAHMTLHSAYDLETQEAIEPQETRRRKTRIPQNWVSTQRKNLDVYTGTRRLTRKPGCARRNPDDCGNPDAECPHSQSPRGVHSLQTRRLAQSTQTAQPHSHSTQT